MILPKSRSELKKFIIKHKLLNYECALCKQGHIWNDKPLSLQLDYINGKNDDNRIENLRFLCPNCHTQTPTYCKAKRTVSLCQLELEKRVFKHIEKSNGMRQLILAIGLSDHGNNYHKVRRVLNRNLENSIVVAFYQRMKFNRTEARHEPRVDSRKVKDRPSKEELLEMLKTLSISQIAKNYNLSSSNSVRAWCRKVGIVTPARGYWQKKKAGKL